MERRALGLGLDVGWHGWAGMDWVVSFPDREFWSYWSSGGGGNGRGKGKGKGKGSRVND